MFSVLSEEEVQKKLEKKMKKAKKKAKWAVFWMCLDTVCVQRTVRKAFQHHDTVFELEATGCSACARSCILGSLFHCSGCLSERHCSQRLRKYLSFWVFSLHKKLTCAKQQTKNGFFRAAHFYLTFIFTLLGASNKVLDRTCRRVIWEVRVALISHLLFYSRLRYR